MSQSWASRLEALAQEDLVMFINACLSCTGQKEFYDSDYGQKVSLDFLHDYILGNYRLLYCRTLAAGINHFNQIQIVLKLLATGKATAPQHQAEENQLITATLHSLPVHRAWKLLQEIRSRGINNRRARAITRTYWQRRQSLEFEAVKYRSKLKSVAVHNHLKLEPELNRFLFRHWDKPFETELFEQFRRGHYSAEAIYSLPYTVAEGLAQKHKIPRAKFLSGIESQMTAGEKLRLQKSSQKEKVAIAINPYRLSLTKLALYILSFPVKERIAKQEELETAIQKSISSLQKKSPLKLGKVAAVLDRSFSTSGTSEKRRRPLGIALAVHYLLQDAAAEYRDFWTIPTADAFSVTAKGQSNLATPLLSALAWQPELVIIISDGWENDPPQGAKELLRVYQSKFNRDRSVSIIHFNPVYNADDYSLKTISPLIPTVGLREAEDLPVVLRFARFAEGKTSLKELEDFLAIRSQEFVSSVEC